MNMGTQGNPESVAHWANKSLFAHKFKIYLRKPRGLWLAFNTCCGECEAGPMVENILEDVEDVKVEADYGGFRPDILLERKDKPPIFIEAVNTNRPSPAKLKYCAKRGIDLFEIDGSRRPIESAVLGSHIAPANCRKERRRALAAHFERLEHQKDPVVEVRSSRQGQQYLIGGVTVERRALLSVLVVFEMIFTSLPRVRAASPLREVRSVLKEVLYPNSRISGDREEGTGSVSVYPGRWPGGMPPSVLEWAIYFAAGS